MLNQKQMRVILSLLLFVHAAMLAWSASRHSPTLNEPAHLAAGISHWQFGHFDLCRVNPPLVRMVAALPALLKGVETDWQKYSDSPGARPTFEIGKDFIAANKERSFFLIACARWACIPFSLVGALVCFLWAKQMFGSVAGLLAATLWCFSPNILGHGQLITSDIAAAALSAAAAFAYSCWLRDPSWFRAAFAGLLLGIAELTKTTLIVFFLLWPLIWLIYKWPDRKKLPSTAWISEIQMLLLLITVAVYVLNAGYSFEGSCTKLGDYVFTSKTLTTVSSSDGQKQNFHRLGNRFVGSWIANVPIPLPKNYVRGIDVQRRDFENFGRPSYLRGEFRDTGWWYYYLYAMAIKVPLGTWLLALLVVFTKCSSHSGGTDTIESVLPTMSDGTCSGKNGLFSRDCLTLLLPPLTILALVSSQTGFSHHSRYVLPVYPFFFVWVSQIGELLIARKRSIATVALCALVWSLTSSLTTYPHTLSYFSELVGGPRRGHNHLINSNLDWGQDLWKLKRWLKDHQDRPLRMAYYGYFDAAAIGLQFSLPPSRSNSQQKSIVLSPGLYAVSVNFLRGFPFGVSNGTGGMGYANRNDFSYFLRLQPTALAGYSIYIYEVDDEITIPLDEPSESPGK